MAGPFGSSFYCLMNKTYSSVVMVYPVNVCKRFTWFVIAYKPCDLVILDWLSSFRSSFCSSSLTSSSVFFFSFLIFTANVALLSRVILKICYPSNICS